jgi:methylenetetrahydrofolate reductase (NADPH)
MAPNFFKEALLDKNGFCVTWEQIPGRGAAKGRQDVLANAAKAAADGLVKAISITDNPSGNPAYAAVMLGPEIKRLGIEPLVHFTLRDKNRNEVESLLYGLAGAEVRSLLVMSGDYPSTAAFGGCAEPVFDLDPVHVLQFIEQMNTGLEYESMGQPVKLPPTDFFAGVAVSPFKKLESEVMCQYFKLEKKIRAGARFIIGQVGYDARKAQELILWLKLGGHGVPALANIYVLSYPAACLMHDNKIPGCVVTDELLKQLEDERKLPDKGKEARLSRAAKMYAVAKGMGYRGSHIGGHGLTYENVKSIVAVGEGLYPRWRELVSEFDYPQPGGFYLFNKDRDTGLNSEELNPALSRGKKSATYNFSRMVHNSLLEPKHPLFPMYQKLAGAIDKSGGLKRLSMFLEHFNKSLLYDCQACGDCALVDTGYLCPVSQCPKDERVGPCGGSFEGWCEHYPGERQCVWVRAYDRLKAYGKLDTLRTYTPPPRDWSLNRTSAWLNFYLGRDHTARRTGLKAPVKKGKP